MNKESTNKLIGLIFIVVGTLAVLGNFDLIPWRLRHYLFQWENILILIGGFLILSDQNRKAGLVVLVIGLIFVIDDWMRVDISIWELWPLIFVFAGIHLIRRTVQKPAAGEPYSEQSANDGDRVEDIAVFSGGDKVVNTKNFKGGSLTAVFGGSNIDLTMSDIQQPSAEIEIFYMFGGSKIRVPKGWQVDMRVTNIFGGMSDKRLITDTLGDSPKRLVVKGLVIFGGAEISN
ncbi:DUF5668 domain-containing protein [uncultured Roseivirga sp.]|uniref:LiaI-LiaF-like domain-containing protein n=1 Tax=uncultured Roseivirga sp. TaxID=543088 RepID=UPI000D7AEA02|nr:DUF5668 domain-containing protein [uncultured Roseivirga sp.]PWL29676.1 MAG: hypothetical protein DCO95_07455 [Roseivirga sp. XM-24bin3]